MLRGVWNKLFIEELRLFPNGVNDDQVDALSDAYNNFVNKKSGSF
jgi:phage terminase large subunit-like protein